MEILTKEEVAQRLKVSLRTIENWISSGTILPPVHIGRRCYWSSKEFDIWLESKFSPSPLGESKVERRGRPRKPIS